MEKLSPSSFTFEKWQAGSLATFGLETREHSITSEIGKAIIKKYAVGYCDGSDLFVRCKPETIAVMFETDTFDEFWTHLTKHEFKEVFGYD